MAGMSMEQKIRNILKMDSILQECVKSMVKFIISVQKDLCCLLYTSDAADE